jgi:hypothetical protein
MLLTSKLNDVTDQLDVTCRLLTAGSRVPVPRYSIWVLRCTTCHLRKFQFFSWTPQFSPLCCHCISSTCSSVCHPRNTYLVSKVLVLNTKQGFGHWISCRPQEQTLRVAWPNSQLMIATDSFTEKSLRITRLWTKYRNLVLNIIGRFP